MLSRGVGHITVCKHRADHDCTELTTGCLGEEQKAGKERGLGDLGKKK